MSVTFLRGGRAGKSIAHGVLAGIYFGNLAFFTAENNATAYYRASYPWDDGDDEWAASLLFGLGGGAVTALTHVSPLPDKTIFFTGNSELKDRAVRRLRSMVLRRQHRPPVNIVFAFGQVSTRNVSTLENRLVDLGYILHMSSYVWDRETRPATDFNLLRRFEVIYDISPNTGVGLSAMWLDEPFVWGGQQMGVLWVSQRYEAFGIFGVVRRYLELSPRSTSMPRAWIGAGAGMVNVDFALKLTDYGTTQGPEHSTVELDRRPLCGYVGAGLEISFARHQTLGIFADYVLGPSYDVDGLPDADIPADEIHVGNFCAGFTVGYHF
jgi:hypothetical protein